MSEELEKEVLDMCNLSQGVRAEGRTEGKLLMLFDLVRDGSLTIEKAAEKANMTVEQFKTALEKIALSAI
ncbi:MAG: hypothetical protein Q4F03_08010 [Eubacteriales bacterium]|nr:hypothetical protein [Eubacteriales bacterium]